MTGRVLAIGLDGYELTVADALIADGRLPALAHLRATSRWFHLDHGRAKRTGLAWEHVATGLSPDAAHRWAAVDFDPATYEVTQEPTHLPPFTAALDARTVVFDPPYFDLARAPRTEGLVAWGAHDPGVAPSSRPDGLHDEIAARFGDYPAPEWIYGFVWPSPERTAAMAAALVAATARRADIAEWLLAERLPDWDLGLVVVSELHSATEALWHGVDPTHPLHGVASAAPALAGVEGVYEEVDRLVGRLGRRFPDATLAVFNLHGMGANDSDPGSMVLLAELLHRHAFGRPHLRRGEWPTTPAGVPLLAPDQSWATAISELFPPRPLLERVASRARGLVSRRPAVGRSPAGPLDWMPAARYRRLWPRMRAFALPSFYDGRIRINLRDREAQGLVPPGEHATVCAELERLLHECRDPVTGAPAVASVERTDRDPMDLEPSEADLVVLWGDAPLGLEHAALGTVGPVPYRRTGGHSGAAGFLYVAGPEQASGYGGVRSAFDVVPSLVDLLGRPPLPGLSGASALPTATGTS